MANENAVIKKAEERGASVWKKNYDDVKAGFNRLKKDLKRRDEDVNTAHVGAMALGVTGGVVGAQVGQMAIEKATANMVQINAETGQYENTWTRAGLVHGVLPLAGALVAWGGTKAKIGATGKAGAIGAGIGVTVGSLARSLTTKIVAQAPVVEV